MRAPVLHGPQRRRSGRLTELHAGAQGMHNGSFAHEPFSSDVGPSWAPERCEGAAEALYANCAAPLATDGFAQCAPLLQGFSVPFSQNTSFPY